MKKHISSRLALPWLRTSTLVEIYERFFLPMIKRMTREDSEIVRFEYLFGRNERVLYEAKAKEGFKLRGEYIHPDSGRICKGVTQDRGIRKDHRVRVRQDSRMPDRTEIEYMGKVYALNAAEWKITKPKLEVVK